MASFFDHQERARGRTGWLVILFVFGTLGITGCVTAIVAFAMPHAWFVAIPVGLGIVGVPFLCKLLSLGSDGASVALALGGVPLSPQASDPAERKVLNVVQEMAIASGMPIPRVYVLDEGSINAFAAGTGPESAVIGVSRGAIEQLTRDELQGVMAHEFSHIFHGDVKINMRAIAAIFGLLAIGYVGYVLLRGAGSVGRGARKGKEAVVVIAAVGLAFIVLGAIGTFFARLMQAAISRQREFLADASAVQYTRNPSGIAGALQKIMVQSDTRMDHAEASQFNHLFFAEGVRSWFASHPPLPSRIERIRAMAAGVLAAPSLNAAPSRSGSASSLAGIGTVTPEALGFASMTLATASEGNRVHDTASAWANILAALLSPESGRREVQRRIITERDPAIMPAIDALAPGLAAMSTAARLGVIELACATLRHDSGDGYESMRALMADVIRSDGRIELYEWVVTELLRVRVERPRSDGVSIPPRTASLVSVSASATRVLGILALLGTSNEAQAQRAFMAGAQRAGIDAVSLPATGERTLDSVARDLAALERLSLRASESLLAAAAVVVSHDASYTDSEYLLLRALSERLGVPLPPSAVQ